MKKKISINQKDNDKTEPIINGSSVPYRCPICGGNGIVSGSFYTSLTGCGGTLSNLTEPCRSCKGTGIIWN